MHYRGRTLKVKGVKQAQGPVETLDADAAHQRLLQRYCLV